ncbi:MAG: hypothetical protein DWQ36_04460 [Acidobacteria bacterium]|nr:MAG: hypothetical protein DWQ30_22050 [Acidobacteriota bacterium]REK10407.1 MAG: hypothetical protein DWQ36_04460 [Acidobacteriota bacterium]
MANDVDSGEPAITGSDRQNEPTLYFFPEDDVTESQLRRILASGGEDERSWAISHLLRFAQWDDIWLYVSRDEVRQLFESIELPETLRAAWARMLKIEDGVRIG